jgi:hypothetical protein
MTEIERGHAIIEEDYGKNWIYDVDLVTLDMYSSTKDLLGQLYGSYDTGLEILRIEHPMRYGYHALNLEKLKKQQIIAINKIRGRI